MLPFVRLCSSRTVKHDLLGFIWGLNAVKSGNPESNGNPVWSNHLSPQMKQVNPVIQSGGDAPVEQTTAARPSLWKNTFP